MPITKTTGFKASDGQLYATVEEAQQKELAAIFEGDGINVNHCAVATVILKHRDAILSILTTGPTSRPSARKKAGTTSPKRAAKRATEAQVASGIKAMREAVDAGTPPTQAAA